MSIIASILLGIVEGLTEFLPISSTGHLILTTNLLGIEPTEFIKSFEVIIQLGAIGAVVALYWQKLLTNIFIIKRVLVAFLPTALLGLVFYKIIKTYLLGNSFIVVLTLIVGGIFLIFFEIWHQEKSTDKIELEQISYFQALVLGLGQSVAMIPGVSRSAATIVGGLGLGIKRGVIVEFSFLLAVPTMVAATGLDLWESSFVFSLSEWGLLLIGFFVSFLTALFAIRSFLAYIQKHDFIAFGLYRLIVALAFLSILLV